MAKFYVDGSKLHPKQNGQLQVKDAGGDVVCGPFSAGSAEKGPWYEDAAAGPYYEKWLKRGVIVEVP
jgi:hypothetical protein